MLLKLEKCDSSASVLAMLTNFEHVATIFCMYPLLKQVQIVSEAMQKISFDIGAICNLIEIFMSKLDQMRNDATFDDCYVEAMGACKYENIHIPDGEEKRKRKHPPKFQDAHHTPGLQPPEDEVRLSYKDKFKRDMWYSYCDQMRKAIKERFNAESMKIGRAVSAFMNFKHEAPHKFIFLLMLIQC